MCSDYVEIQMPFFLLYYWNFSRIHYLCMCSKVRSHLFIGLEIEQASNIQMNGVEEFSNPKIANLLKNILFWSRYINHILFLFNPFQVLFAEPIVVTACEFLEQNASLSTPTVSLVGYGFLRHLYPLEIELRAFM